MITEKETLCEIQKYLPEVQQVIEIHEGFSTENKYLIKCKNMNYLLRHSKDKNYQKKKEEFDLTKACYENGVKCNKPIDIFVFRDSVYTLLEYIEGEDGESVISKIEHGKHFQIGKQAGIDLKKITSIKGKDNTWLERKWKKHQRILDEYSKSIYRFKDDNKIIEFINENYKDIEHENDYLQHDDFHLGNIIINKESYAGINGYFGTNKLTEDIIKTITVYVAMAIISTIVWTLKYYLKTMPYIEKINNRIIDEYRSFEVLRPLWAL